MFINLLMSALFALVLGDPSYPNVYLTLKCNMTLNGNNITFENSFGQTETREEAIYFSACQDLNQVGCDRNAFACVVKKDNIINLLRVYNSSGNYKDESYFLITSEVRCEHEKFYELKVDLSYTNIKYKFSKETNCKYRLEINPNHRDNCVKFVEGRRLDFSDLKEDFLIKTGSDRISFNLCGQSPSQCKNNVVSACRWNNETNSITPFGRINTEHIKIEDEQIVLHYKTPQKEGKGSISIILKCNWTTPKYYKSHRIVSPIRLEIVVETYAACITRPRNCVVSDTDNYLYNITELSYFKGYNVDSGNIKLNICGGLKSGTKSCSSQLSHVCFMGGRELNYGTSMSTISIENDIMKFSINDGSQCPEDSNVNLKTNFELICSFREEPPKVIKQHNCTLEILWRTSHACPIKDMNDHNVAKGPTKTPQCSIEHETYRYNLSNLTLHGNNYIIKEGSLDFVLNVCAPVTVGSDLLCRNTMGMCFRNNSEPNMKRRYFNIATIGVPKIQNGKLVLKYSNGMWCQKHKLEASAVIYLNCLETNDSSSPKFIKEEDCLYEFSWDTKAACAIVNSDTKKETVLKPEEYYEVVTEKQTRVNKNCIVHYGNHSIDLNILKPIKVQSYTIGFNKSSTCPDFICDKNNPIASLEECPLVRAQQDELVLSFSNKFESRSSEIVFFCETESNVPVISVESANLVSFRYPLQSLCKLSVGNLGLIIGGIVGCVFIILSVLIFWNRNHLIRIYQRLTKRNCSKERTYVYCRNSED